MLCFVILICSLVWVFVSFKVTVLENWTELSCLLWFFLLKQKFHVGISCLGKLAMYERILFENTIFKILNSGKNGVSAYRKTCNLLHHYLGTDSKTLIPWCLNHAHSVKKIQQYGHLTSEKVEQFHLPSNIFLICRWKSRILLLVKLFNW